MFKDLVTFTPMYVTFFWAVVLLVSNTKNKAKQFLGFFMVAAFLVYLSHVFYFKGNHFAYLYFDPVYIFASLSVYPMYFWYIKILTVETEYNWKNLCLLAPAFLLFLISTILYLLMSHEEKFQYLQVFLLNNTKFTRKTILIQLQEIVFYVSRLVFTVQIIYFLIKGRKLVIVYNKRIENFYSNLESKTIVWVNFLLYSFVFTSLMSIVFNLIGRSKFLNSTGLLFIPSSIFSVLLFFIGFQGYMQNYSVKDLVEDETTPKGKKQRDYNIAQLKEKLSELFVNEKIYTKSDLKITHISAKLLTNRTYISNLINTEYSCSFSEFVNEYRIIEAKKLLSDKTMQNYSLEGISEMVGFGSLNTFMRVFKESEGLTPGRYREMQILKDINE